MALPALSPPFVKVIPINTGSLELPEEAMIEGGATDVAHPITVLSFLIDHPKNGLVLYDLGLSQDFKKKDYGRWKPIAEFLDKWNITFYDDFDLQKYIRDTLKYKLNNIHSVVFSHFHWDHVGDINLFPDKTRVFMGCGINEIRHNVCCCGREHYGFFGTEFPKCTKIEEVKFTENKSVKVGPFDKCYDFYGDGTLFIVDGPGHVEGHIMLLAKTQIGWVLMAGDAVYHNNSYMMDKPIAKGTFDGESADIDPTRSFETMQKIHAFYNMENSIIVQAHLMMKTFDQNTVLYDQKRKLKSKL